MKRGFEGDHRDAAKAPRLRDSNDPLLDVIESSSTEIFHAMRLARGFERQKLGRRQKDARENKSVDDVARIDKEIAVLKGLDLAAMAEFYLHKTLLRMPAISSAPQFPSSIATKVAESSKPVDATYLNVSARLFKSNATSSALESSLRSIYELLGIEPQLGRKKRLRKSDFQPASSILTDQKPKLKRDRISNGQSENATTSSGPEMMTHQLSDDAIEPDKAKDDHETGSNSSEGLSSNDNSDASSESSAERRLSNDEIDDVPIGKLEKKRAAPTTTAFLPSLAGGYISGSDSNASDVDDLEDLKAKKNRPGQRARQARWEQKYGSNAAHIKKQRQSRDHGWDARRGAQDAPTRDKGKSNTSRNGTYNYATESGRFPPASNQRELAKSTRGEQQASRLKEAPLHPSWEAAKNQKEQKSAAVFQGKKVVFD